MGDNQTQTDETDIRSERSKDNLGPAQTREEIAEINSGLVHRVNRMGGGYRSIAVYEVENEVKLDKQNNNQKTSQTIWKVKEKTRLSGETNSQQRLE